MAITVCSSASNPSPTISLKSSPLKISHQTHLHHHPLKQNLDLFSNNNNNALAIARESLASAFELMIVEQRVESRDWSNGCLLRRRRRRKRRKEGGGENDIFEEDEDKDFIPLMETSFAKSAKYLTVKEEAQCSMYMKEEARIESVRRQILESSDHEPTTKQWAKAVGMRSRNLTRSIFNGKMAQERVLRCYRRLVISIANSYQGKGISLQDLIQEGSIGLICGVKKFDPNKGYKMSTYIYYWIRQAMIKAIAEKSRVVRLPGNVCAKLPKLAEIRSNLSQILHRVPSPEEIAEAAYMDVATVRLICLRIRSPISPDHPVTRRGKMSIQDIVSGPKEMTPEAMVKKQHKKQYLEKLLGTLCDREATVLRLYYGLNGQTPRSYEEMGKLFKISRERVRQLRRIAISKLSQSNSSVIENLKLYTM